MLRLLFFYHSSLCILLIADCFIPFDFLFLTLYTCTPSPFLILSYLPLFLSFVLIYVLTNHYHTLPPSPLSPSSALSSGVVGKVSSTLKADIEYFVKFLTAFALLQAALVFIVGVTRGISPVQGIHLSYYSAVHLCIYLSIHSAHSSIHPKILCLFLYTYPSICLSVCLFIFLSTRISFYAR